MARTLGGFAFCIPGLAMAAVLSARAGEPPSVLASALPDPDLSEVVVTAHKLTESLWKKNRDLDESRDKNLLPKTGATEYDIDQQAVEALPQGKNTPLDKVILQIPGVSYDSAVSNPNFHVRNEYANVQYRINGVLLPEGVSGLGPVLDTNFIGSMSLLTGTLPAQYGLRTAGVLDITSRSFSAPSGDVSIYGGSRETITPSFDYGGSVDNTQYFVTARGNWNSLGIENPTSTLNATHDHTEQGKVFGFAS